MIPERKKVLITVKTYPTLSKTYDELVCTAGFLEDGSWIRLYPIPFRKLAGANQYRKWEWIELDLIKNEKDFRRESYRPYNIDGVINIGNRIGTSPKEWIERKKIVLRNIYYDMDVLISEARNQNIGTSLAVFKPTEILDFYWEDDERDWDQSKLDAVLSNIRQPNLFDTQEEQAIKSQFVPVNKLPYKFKYRFKSRNGSIHNIMIEDWEVGALYFHYIKKGFSETYACQKIKEKFFDNLVNDRDLYFFLGTSLKWHNVGINPFMIIGVFYPPKEKTDIQPTLPLFD